MGLTALALLSLATIAQAGVMLQTTNLGVPTRTGTGADSLPGYTAFKLTLVATGADTFTAYDFWTQANGFGVTNLAQRWSYDSDADAYNKTLLSPILNNTTSPLSLDSHWLHTALQTPGSPDETNQMNGLIGHPFVHGGPGWGNGNIYYGSSVGTTPLTTLDIAYVIVRDVDQGAPVGHIKGTVALGDNITKITIDQDIIPEPTSLSLLGLGGLALLRRRR
jgi:hypothetical protein